MQNIFFVVGPPRSGTTLFSRMLDMHENIAIPAETWLFSTLWRFGASRRITCGWQYTLILHTLFDSLKADDPDAAGLICEMALENPGYTGSSRALVQEFLSRYQRKSNSQLVGERTAGDLMRISIKHRMFPDAHYVIIMRNPPDIIASNIDAFYRGEITSESLLERIEQLKLYCHKLFSEKSWKGRKFVLITYEDLVAKPEETLRTVCDFLSLEFSPSMLRFFDNPVSRNLASSNPKLHKRVVKGLDKSRLGRSREKFSPEQMALIEAFFEEEMRRLGYEFRSTPQERARYSAIVRSKGIKSNLLWPFKKMKNKGRGLLKLGVARLFPHRFSVPLSREDWEERLASINAGRKQS